MKRHEALIPLSRDHHEALILAQLLKTDAPDYAGLPTTVVEKSAYALNMFNKNLQPHFLSEEKILSVVKDCHPDITKLAAEILWEHRQLTDLFLSLNASTATETALNMIGNELEAHIRKEERILFPMIQQHCPEEILQSLIS
jgi:iron-sulfur cluster repair protein YtfE (RIC family)